VITINWSPQAPAGDLPYTHVSVRGWTIILDEEEFDFSPMEDGDLLPYNMIDDPRFVGPVEREGSNLILTITLAADAHSPEATRFPSPSYLHEAGQVHFPPFRAPEIKDYDED